MKRSEMIKLIMETYRYKGHGSLMRYDEAESVLNAIEAAGMMPPEVEVKIADNEYGCEEEGYFTRYQNKWEPEDEK